MTAVPIFAMDAPTEKGALKMIESRSHGFIVNTDVLNVRKGPGTSYAVVGKLYYGDYVWMDPELDYIEGWTGIYGVNSKGQNVRGYVASKYVNNVS